MTRINLVPVGDLTPKHLSGEFHEISRVFNLVRSRVLKGHSPRDVKMPSSYTMGKGHVLFFFDKLKFISSRYKSLGRELLARNPSSSVDFQLIDNVVVQALEDIPSEWWNDYTPSPLSISISKNRIQEKLDEK